MSPCWLMGGATQSGTTALGAARGRHHQRSTPHLPPSIRSASLGVQLLPYSAVIARLLRYPLVKGPFSNSARRIERMSADGSKPKAPPSLPTQPSQQRPATPLRRRSDRICVSCELPIGESEFSVGLRSGRSLHLDCYLSLYQHGDRPAA